LFDLVSLTVEEYVVAEGRMWFRLLTSWKEKHLAAHVLDG